MKSQFLSTSKLENREALASFDSTESVELLLCVARALELAIESPRNPEEPTLDEQAHHPTRCLFESVVVPNITIEKYLRRLKAGFKCSDTAFVLALIIVDRVLENPAQDPHRLSVTNVHRLFLASLIAAVKFNEDLVYNNSQYAKAGGIQLKEVNRLEMHLFRFLGFSFYVAAETYQEYDRHLRDVAASSLVQPRVPAGERVSTPHQPTKKHEAEAIRSGVALTPIAKTPAGPTRSAPLCARLEFRAWSEASTASSPCGSVTSAATWNPNASPFYPKAALVEPKRAG